MRISIFGMGYVGAVTAGCLAREGHEVWGVDPNPTKVDLINSGQPPIVEEGVAELIEAAVSDGRLRALADPGPAIEATEVSMICVGTPSQSNGSLSLEYVRHVCEEIGGHLRGKDDYHVVVCRSTVLPGTMESIVIPTLEAASGKTAGEDFGVCNNPEFLREGTAVRDFYSPPKTVIGSSDPRSADIVAGLYSSLEAPLVVTDLRTAEMAKYADNVWHALKVCFANELGNICKGSGVDSHAVMDVFFKDEKLNLSKAYLTPGFAFGGSCLPKDVRALVYRGRALDLETPVLGAIMSSNWNQIERAAELIIQAGSRKVSVLGFSFKGGTDDLRESPMIEVIERLIGKGYDLRVYDANVNLSNLIGANREYLLDHVPHISSIMVPSMKEALDHGETIVIGNYSPEFESVGPLLSAEQKVVDLVRIDSLREASGAYEGICW